MAGTTVIAKAQGLVLFVDKEDDQWLMAHWQLKAGAGWSVTSPERTQELASGRHYRPMLVFKTQKLLDEFRSSLDPGLFNWQLYVRIAQGLKHQCLVLTRHQLMARLLAVHPASKRSTTPGKWYERLATTELKSREAFAVTDSLIEPRGSAGASFGLIIDDSEYRSAFMRLLAEEDIHVEKMRQQGSDGVPVKLFGFDAGFASVAVYPELEHPEMTELTFSFELGGRWFHSPGFCHMGRFRFSDMTDLVEANWLGVRAGFLTEMHWPKVPLAGIRDWESISREAPFDVLAAS